MSLYIELRSNISIEFYASVDNSVYVEVEADGQSENVCGNKEISEETLKSYIDKLQELYDSIQEKRTDNKNRIEDTVVEKGVFNERNKA